MSRIRFIILLQKYQNGIATEAESIVVENWYALLEEEPRQLTEKQWSELEDRLWLKLEGNALGHSEEAKIIFLPFWQRTYFKMGLVGTIVLVLGFSIFYYQNILTKDKFQDGFELVINPTEGIKSVLLEDGSRVLLNPKSELRFPPHFALGKREVYLQGEAFFEITGNPNRPFLVNAGKITTKVLGTSFRVKAIPENAEIEVAVATGKVSVYEQEKDGDGSSNQHGNGVVLTPNHRVIYSEDNNLFVMKLVDNPMSIANSNEDFSFDDTPLSEVLNRLKKAYGIDIEVDNKSLYECPLTADISNKGLYAQLSLVCAAIRGNYEVKGTIILISGKGCDYRKN